MRRTVNSTPPSVLRAVFPEAAASPASRPGRLALQPLPARWHHGRAQSDRDPALWPPFSRHLSPDPRGLLREGLPLVPTTRSHLDLCGPWARGGSLEKHLQTDTLCPNPRVPRVFAAGGQGARARRLGGPFRDYPWRGRSPNAEADKLGLFLIVIRWFRSGRLGGCYLTLGPVTCPRKAAGAARWASRHLRPRGAHAHV